MGLLSLDVSSELAKALVSIGVTTTIYSTGERPTKGLPNAYIEILDNGYMSTRSSEYGINSKPLLLGVWVKLIQQKGMENTINKAMTNVIIKSFEDALLKGISSNNLFFELNKLQMFTLLRNIPSGYSYQQFNINTIIIKT